MKNQKLINVLDQIKQKIENNQLEEALELCRLEETKNYIAIIAQKIKIYVLQEHYGEALAICDKHPNSIIIQNQRRAIMSQLKVNANTPTDYNLNAIATKVFFDDMSLEQLSKIPMSSWEKTILTIAYYEKNNKKMGIKYIKEQMPKFSYDSDKKKALNILKERLVSNRTIFFNCQPYCRILSIKIVSGLEKHILEKKAMEEKANQIPSSTPNAKPIQASAKASTKKGNPLPVFAKRVPIQPKIEEPKEIVTTPKKTKTSRTMLDIPIREYYKKELLTIKQFLYCVLQNPSTRNSAAKVWDRLERLEEKSVLDVKSHQAVCELITKVEKLTDSQILVKKF